jgi:hypothetical protein
LNRCLRTALGLFALLSIGAGCGSNSGEKAEPGKPIPAGPDTRIKFKDEYKQMLGKDGKMLWKPSESKKRPQGIPKS